MIKQLFDTVCGQTDRHYANRFVSIMEEEKRIVITGVQGIDHDLSFGRLKYHDLLEEHGKLPAFVELELDEEEMIARSMNMGKFGKKVDMPAPNGKKEESERKEKCSMPALDEDMVAFLWNLTKEDLGYYLGDLLKGEYMDAMWDRLSGVVKVIERTLKEKPDLLVKKENWNMDVAKRFAGTTAAYIYVNENDITEEPQHQ